LKTLVIIDDEGIVIQGITAIISKLNLEISVIGSATDGIEGREVIRKLKPDIVITDIRMPGLDGLSLIEEIQEELPSIYFIVISGYTDFVYTQHAIELGVEAYLDKPITIEKIQNVFVKLKVKEAEKKVKKISLKADDLVINALILEDAKSFRENTEIFLSNLSDQIESSFELKEICYRFLCVIQEIFAGQRKKYDDRMLIPCTEIMSLEKKEDIIGYVNQNINKIASLMEAKQVGSDHHIISQLIQYINDNYNKDIGLTELADQVGMNPAYLSLLFKEEVGTSYVKYLTGIRMDKAKKLLVEGHRISDVAEKVGYNNYRYFCDIFKKHVGMTPSEYRS